jgi:hypothetical protein
MTAPDEKARQIVKPFLYQQKGPIDAFALEAAITAALIEARGEGVLDVLRQIRETMPTREKANDLIFGPMGLNYSLMNGYHDVAIDDLAFVLETERMALIEARRAALEEEEKVAEEQRLTNEPGLIAVHRDAFNAACRQIAAATRALIPTRPDGAAEGESNG